MKKGFTLIELLAVISIMGLLAVAIVPNVISTYNESLIKLMVTEENNVTNMAKLYAEDYCVDMLGSETGCPDSYKPAVGKTVRYICLNNVQSMGYIGKIDYKKSVCSGITIFEFSKPTSMTYSGAKTYLWCGTGDTSYETKNQDVNGNPIEFEAGKSMRALYGSTCVSN